jgi:hypothetical protein
MAQARLAAGGRPGSSGCSACSTPPAGRCWSARRHRGRQARPRARGRPVGGSARGTYLRGIAGREPLAQELGVVVEVQGEAVMHAAEQHALRWGLHAPRPAPGRGVLRPSGARLALAVNGLEPHQAPRRGLDRATAAARAVWLADLGAGGARGAWRGAAQGGGAARQRSAALARGRQRREPRAGRMARRSTPGGQCDAMRRAAAALLACALVCVLRVLRTARGVRGHERRAGDHRRRSAAGR